MKRRNFFAALLAPFAAAPLVARFAPKPKRAYIIQHLKPGEVFTISSENLIDPSMFPPQSFVLRAVVTNPRCSWCGHPSHEPAVDELVICPKCGTAGVTCDEWRAEADKQYAEAKARVDQIMKVERQEEAKVAQDS